MDDRKPGVDTDDPVRQALIALLDEEPDRPDRIWNLVKDNLSLILKLKEKHSYKKIAATLSKKIKIDVKEKTLRTYTGRILRRLKEVETQVALSTEPTIRLSVSEQKPSNTRAPASGQAKEGFKTTPPDDKDY